MWHAEGMLHQLITNLSQIVQKQAFVRKCWRFVTVTSCIKKVLWLEKSTKTKVETKASWKKKTTKVTACKSISWV